MEDERSSSDWRSTQTDQTETSLADQLTRVLQNLQPQQSLQSHHTVTLSTKLNQYNYSLWARLMRMAIGSRGQLRHITGVPAPPEKSTLDYTKWEQTDLLVCSWMLDNMEAELITDYAEYPTAKDLWDGLATTYSQGREGVQLFDLTVRANTMKQGTDTLEVYYSKLQRLWREIEVRQPNPMICADDITMFNKLRSDQKLYQFLAGIGEEFDSDKRDLLKTEPLPTSEAAYATIRRERDRRKAMTGNLSSAVTSGVGAGLLSSLVAASEGGKSVTEKVSTGQSYSTKP
ncbi:hypothetical protein ES319_D10G203300v1 [Gossypium barbadense]|uniref:Retrotransposon Copia-like N-terminal domain-containing protein n=1 Tax=Gossypium barbadense TaxID=3634 RepID=A0A5J5PTG7_GOSBA|nr:hypothetical protein ES319_D10G203300v1 [Gossypium barbadense]